MYVCFCCRFCLFVCVFYGHLRVLRHQNNIVFIAVVVVNGDKPVALLHEEVWQASNQLLKKNVAFDSDLENIGWARSFFICNLRKV